MKIKNKIMLLAFVATFALTLFSSCSDDCGYDDVRPAEQPVNKPAKTF